MLLEILVEVLLPIAVVVVLPITIVWLVTRMKMYKINKNTEIVLGIIEKDSNIDVDEVMRKIAPNRKLLKEKLLVRLLRGWLATVLGIGMIGLDIYYNIFTNRQPTLRYFGIILLGIGVAYIVNYYVGKRFLAKEIELEEKQLVAHTINK